MSKGDLHKPTPIVKDPKLFKAVDPFKVRDLVTYESIDMKKIAWSLKNYKRSAIYIAGCLGVFFVAKILADVHVHNFIIGSEGNGGAYLTLWSKKSTADYAYNREFQRMMYLSEGAAANEEHVSKQLMVDLGVDIKNYGSNPTYHRKAPHPKYY